MGQVVGEGLGHVLFKRRAPRRRPAESHAVESVGRLGELGLGGRELGLDGRELAGVLDRHAGAHHFVGAELPAHRLNESVGLAVELLHERVGGEHVSGKVFILVKTRPVSTTGTTTPPSCTGPMYRRSRGADDRGRRPNDTSVTRTG